MIDAAEQISLRERCIQLEIELEAAVEALRTANLMDGYPGSTYDLAIRSAERVLRVGIEGEPA